MILTCDAGTTGCKCSVFDFQGKLVRSEKGEYKTHYPRPNWAEQKPTEVWSAVIKTISKLLERVKAERIACVGLSGTMNGCIPVDTEGNALYPNIIHSDSRAYNQLEEIASVIDGGSFYELTGCRLDHHYTLPKVLWMRQNHPKVYKDTHKWLNIKDFLHGCFTGNYSKTDYSDASLNAAMDLKKRKWASDLLGDLKIDCSMFPELCCGNDVSLGISASAAGLTGLQQGTPVAVGGGDGSCAARGAGLSRFGQTYGCIGSSAWISQLVPTPPRDPLQRVFSYLDMDGQSYLTCGTMQCGTAALDWARQHLLGGAEKGVSIAEIEEMALTTQAGAEGVFFLPTLMGERTPYWDANTRGCLLGFSLYHNDAHIARAVYEGVAYALRSCGEAIAESGQPIDSVMLTGGGAKSKLWSEILASMLNAPINTHYAPAESTSLGAAIAAGVGIGVFKSYADGCALIRSSASHAPKEDWKKTYDKNYPVYEKMYGRLKPLFDEIAKL